MDNKSHSTSATTTTATTSTTASITIPVISILAFRKAITSMKDVGAYITLRTTLHMKTFLEISVTDHFESSAMYAHIPICATNDVTWVNIGKRGTKQTRYNAKVLSECH